MSSNPDTTRPQPESLRELLRHIQAARKLLSLYGPEHPSAVEAVDALIATWEVFAVEFHQATTILTKKSVVVNEHYYDASEDSRNLCAALRERGAMAFTLIGASPGDQTVPFLGFLNADPIDVRAEGGASAYLRSRGVSRLVVTESVYCSGEDDEDDQARRREWDTSGEDRVISSVIDWLARQQQDGQDDEETPKFPITEILSDPLSAARLIREAVTKLHASKRGGAGDGEAVLEAVNDLKGIAEAPGEWDSSVPQIRRAISKLPREMRPTISGFTADFDDVDDLGDAESPRVRNTADASEVEEMVHGILGAGGAIDISALEKLFGARAEGLLARWRSELQPASVMDSTGKTLETLMSWERSPLEHGRITHALAALVPRAAEIDDFPSAIRFVASLLDEARRADDAEWRATNARAAVAGLGPELFSALITYALSEGDYRARETAAALVEQIPDAALAACGNLGTSADPVFAKALGTGLSLCGARAVDALSAMARNGVPAAREAAFDLLAGVSIESAIKEVNGMIKGGDWVLAAKAVGVLAGTKVPAVTQMCLALLGAQSPEVRIAAIEALGRLADYAALGELARIAKGGFLKKASPQERVAAVEAIGRIGVDEALTTIRAVAAARPFFGKSDYEPVRAAAKRILDAVPEETREAA